MPEDFQQQHQCLALFIVQDLALRFPSPPLPTLCYSYRSKSQYPSLFPSLLFTRLPYSSRILEFAGAARYLIQISSFIHYLSNCPCQTSGTKKSSEHACRKPKQAVSRASKSLCSFPKTGGTSVSAQPGANSLSVSLHWKSPTESLISVSA